MSASGEMESYPWKNGDPVSNVIRHKEQMWVSSWSVGPRVQLGEMQIIREWGQQEWRELIPDCVYIQSWGRNSKGVPWEVLSLRPSQCAYIEASTVRPSMYSLTMGLQYMCFLSLTKNIMWLYFGNPGVNPVCYKWGRSDEIWGWERGKNLWYLWKIRLKLD